MKLHIKSIPDDFCVEEIAPLPLTKKGSHAVYLLEKRGWNTTDALREITQRLKIPYSKISYGGRKDRHAFTRQYISIKDGHAQDLTVGDFSMTFRGFMDVPMAPDMIEGNRFEITVRKLADTACRHALAEAATVASIGFINYFDDQRFGSFDPQGGFIAAKILKGHLNGAVKILLTARQPDDKNDAKVRKEFFVAHWKDWPACLSQAQTPFEHKAFETLQSTPKALDSLVLQIPREDLSLYIAAYQSFLWNELVRRLVVKMTKAVRVYKGEVGDYIFPPAAEKDTQEALKKLKIPTAAHNTQMPDKTTEILYAQILKDEEITKPMFNKIKTRQAFFKAFDRSMLVIPKEFSYEASADDLNPGKKKLVLKFILPRGSYATMLIKRLFSTNGGGTDD